MLNLERERYRVALHVGPLRQTQADEVLDRMRAYRGSIPVGGFNVGTETVYFDVNNSDQLGAKILAMEFLMVIFGAGTGLTRAITRCERINAGA
jgi:hypothetical protein